MKHVLSLALGLSLLLTGCIPLLAGGAAGGFSVAYVAGELQAEEEVSIDEAYMAAQRALEGLELTVTTREKDAMTAKVIAVGAEDKQITVRLERKANLITTVKIRVGMLGDQQYSLLILDRIESQLGVSNGVRPQEQMPYDNSPGVQGSDRY